MPEVLVGIAGVLLAAVLVLLLLLVLRRMVLAHREQRHRAAVRRVRPLAIAIIEGDDVAVGTLSADDQAVLAEVLGRYARKLRGEARGRIAAHFRDSAALANALRDLRARRTWQRAAAAYRLGDMGCEEVAPTLLGALDDPKREVRGAAARSLGRLGVAAAALPLVKVLVSRRVPNGVAGEALLELGADIRPELRTMAGHPDPPVRGTAITLLGLVGDSGDAPVAATALGDPAADVRRAAAEALGRIGTFDDEAALRAALDDRMHFVRAEAASALGVIDAPQALPQLVEIARNDRFRPARAAARAVARIDPATLRSAAAEPGAGPHLHEAADLLAVAV
jgi:HEAT repeat protein